MTLPMPVEQPHSEWAVYVRDDTLRRIAQLDEFDGLDMTPKFNAVGSWQLTIDRRISAVASLFRPGFGIEVTRDGARFLAGPVTNPKVRRTDAEHTATIVGVDDLTWLARRQAHPQPLTAAPPYSSTEYDVRTGVCSTVLRAYVEANAGPGALLPRQVPGLALGADPGVGSPVMGRARWQVLLDMLTELAVSGGGLGFDVVQDGTQLLFTVYQPVDRSTSIKFSEGLGTLASYDLSIAAPAVTYTYVAGGGEGTARVVFEREGADAAGWGRIEQFVDRRDTSDLAELAQKSDETLTEGAEKTTLGAVPIETAQVRYGVDYSLGDRVTLVLDDEEDTAVSELIRQVDVKITLESQRLVPTIGTPGAHDLLRVAGAMRDLSARMRDLERR